MIYDNFEFYLEGEQYQQDFINSIKNAKKTICLHTYIFKLDDFGNKVYKCLLEKANQGVVVNLLIDFIGSYYLDQKLKNKLTEIENFYIAYFNPIKTPKILQIGRRLHHKILIIDQEFAIIGGINIIAGKKPKTNKVHRLDFAVKVQSEAIKKLYDYCLQISETVNKGGMEDPLPKISTESNKSILFHYNDWINNRKQITSRYLNLIKEAKKSIYLVHGYFFPSFRIINNLINKSRQGVKVTLILPKHSDWQSWVWATEYLYSKLMKNEIEILEWDLSELHGKLAIFDEEIILVGSYNLNYTSSYGNLEMNVEINDHDFVNKVMKNEMNYIVSNSIKLNLKTLSGWSWVSRLRNIFYYIALLIISTFSINWIKTSRHVKNMSALEKIIFFALMFIGLLGIILPVIPGIPFLLAGMVLMMKKRDDY